MTLATTARAASTTIVCVCATLGGSARGMAADRDLVVANRSRHAMQELYVSPSRNQDWGDDRLHNRLIRPGGATRVRVTGDCIVDVQIIYDDASHEERHDLDACSGRPVTFDGKGVLKPAKAGGAPHQVTIVNAAPRPMQQVFISSSDAGEWGADLLRSGSLSVGDRTALVFAGSCVADLRVVFDNRSAEERREIDLCALGNVTIRPGWTTDDSLTRPPPVLTQDLPRPDRRS